MSEVQRFWSHEASNIRCVREADFDRVTAERDAANECKDLATEQRDLAQAQAEMSYQKQRYAEIHLKNSNSKIDALQARLTAADERADRLEVLLRRVIDSGQLLSASSVGEALEEDIEAALRGVMQGE